ncbi:glyoxalase/bleomycin resistance/dioxygenase family protein (plasmid) [Aliisedimentitalea scapharcae]|uniref:Glyoxalase/bleomycin resistance/dioxygenase family protein n=1 Tax=Aliisedimentitalea scapharcae TaxID=1524259 RepID=A0ABZ2XZC6_9RHOB
MEVFGCEIRRPLTVLSGAAFSKGNGLHGVKIRSAWLSLPGSDSFLELLEYSETAPRTRPRVNEPGWGHLSFAVPDIHQTCVQIIGHGGEWQGDITNLGSDTAPFLAIYMRDPEGNILELEQSAS